MYQVIIIEDDPMVAAIDKQYVEADSQFRVVRTFKSGGEALAHLPELKADLDVYKRQDGDNPAAQQDVIEIVKDLYREAGKSESWIEAHVRASGPQSWKFKAWGETDHSVTKVVAWYYLGQPYMDVEKGTSLKAGDTYQYSGKEESYEKYQYTMDYVYTLSLIHI